MNSHVQKFRTIVAAEERWGRLSAPTAVEEIEWARVMTGKSTGDYRWSCASSASSVHTEPSKTDLDFIKFVQQQFTGEHKRNRLTICKGLLNRCYN
jgi:hypothetical protein